MRSSPGSNEGDTIEPGFVHLLAAVIIVLGEIDLMPQVKSTASRVCRGDEP
jgi:hypothetical protein